MRMLLYISLALIPLCATGQYSITQKSIVDVFEWNDCDDLSYDHLPFGFPQHENWIRFHAFKKATAISPDEMIDAPYSVRKEFEYEFDISGRIKHLMIYEVVQYKQSNTASYLRKIQDLNVQIETNSQYKFPEGYQLLKADNRPERYILKLNNLGDTLFFLIGDHTLSKHAYFSKALLKNVQWNYENEEIITESYTTVSSDLSGEVGSLYALSAYEVRSYTDRHLTDVKSITFPTETNGSVKNYYQVEQQKTKGNKNDLFELYQAGHNNLNAEFIAILNQLADDEILNFEVSELVNSEGKSIETRVRVTSSADNKSSQLIAFINSPVRLFIVNTEPSENGGTMIKQYLVSEGKPELVQVEGFDTMNRIVFIEKRNGKRVNYKYNESNMLSEETVLQRCIKNDSYRLTNRDLKRNYCIHRKEIESLPPFTQIENCIEELRSHGWNYTFQK